MNYVEHLKEEGWVVIPCLGEKVSMVTHNEAFRDALSKMPEYKNAPDMVRNGTPFVKGGMAALGNPSSFHNSYVRTIRQWAHNAALKEVFLPILQKDKELKFEQDIDRMLFRRPPAKPGAESWHRDESLNAKEGDTIYGGWINLDTEPQYFSGCPKSHLEPDAMRQNQGFAKIDKSDYGNYDAMKEKITIEPGHIFIFYERMVHEVLPSAKKKDQCRLFLGWRTTYESTPLVKDLRQRLEDKAVMPIKSGQIPAMYSKMHWMLNRVSNSGKPGQRDQLAEWSNNFKPQCTELRTIKSGADEGKEWTVVHQNMKSLKDYNLLDGFNSRGSFIPVYKSDEIALLFPNRKWNVLKIESSNDYEVIEADSTEPKLDRSHTKLRTYIKNNETSKIKQWMEKEGIDWKKICDDDATDTEDESSDDEDKNKSPVKKGRLDISDDDDSDSDSSDDDNKNPNVKRIASYTDDDDSDDEKLNNNMIDLTLNSEEEVTCPIRTTIDKIAAAFIAEYAPWTTFGLRRRQYVKKRKFLNKEKYIAYLWYFASDPINPRGASLKSLLYRFETLDWTQVKMAIKGKNIYDPLDIFEGLKVEDQEYFLDKIRREIYQTWNMDDSLINFHTGRKPKDMKNDILKLYVWEQSERYIVAGEALAMETIYKHLPYSYAWSYKKGYVRATQQKASDRNFKITYSKNRVNTLEMRAFQRSINIINERFKNAVLSTTAPYLDKIEPNPLQQILGWDVEVQFPQKARQILTSQRLQPLGHCGPIRERRSINETWRYRFGIHSTDHPTRVDVLRYGLHAYSKKIFEEPVSIYYDVWSNMWNGTIVLQRFLNDDNVRIAYAGWGSKKGRTGHARILYKSGVYIYVLDPWIQSTTKHKAGYKVMRQVVTDHSEFTDVIFVQRAAEQAKGEGSCAAISCARALALVELGTNKTGALGEIPTWCPVFVKMLYNKFGKHDAARQRAIGGGAKGGSGSGSSSSVRLKL